jgi:predicted metalloprotease with PDZ domain
MIRKMKSGWIGIIIFSMALTNIPFFTACKGPSSSVEEQKAANGLPTLDVLLRVIKDANGSISHIEVALEMSAIERTAEKPFVLMSPVKYTVVSGIADRLEGLRVTDDEGDVEIKQLEDKSAFGGMVIWRKWQAIRPVMGPVKVHYRARIPEPERRVPGPPYHLCLNGGGVSGAGCGFMALPEEEGEFSLRLHWDLEAFEPGSAGVSSLGDGNIETAGPIDRLFQSWYIAGPLGRYPEESRGEGFSSAWLGDPPFDVQELVVWSDKAFEALKSFFRDKSPASYRFFMRIGPGDQGGGGTALYNSFMLYVPVEPELAQDPRGTVFHEMTHKWVGGIEGAAGDVFWFTEGLTVHYTRAVMYHAGLCSAEKFLEDVNGTVISFLTNPLRNMANDEIAKKFWEDRNAQRLPYQRGSLYFAYVDGKLRAASDEKRSLDDVVLSLFERRTEKEPLTKDLWLEELKKVLGPSALTEFEAIIIRGEDFIPDSDAFGSEFKRIPIKYRVFELGFDERESLYSSEKLITGLVKGSAAERAGLQNGDLVLNKVNLEALRDDENLSIKLDVQRGDQTLAIEYLPRGESVDVYKWVIKEK